MKANPITTNIQSIIVIDTVQILTNFTFAFSFFFFKFISLNDKTNVAVVRLIMLAIISGIQRNRVIANSFEVGLVNAYKKFVTINKTLIIPVSPLHDKVKLENDLVFFVLKTLYAKGKELHKERTKANKEVST
jgi:hypothetical protein